MSLKIQILIINVIKQKKQFYEIEKIIPMGQR